MLAFSWTWLFFSLLRFVHVCVSFSLCVKLVSCLPVLPLPGLKKQAYGILLKKHEQLVIVRILCFSFFFLWKIHPKAKERRLTSRVGFIRNVSFFSVYLSSFCDETKNFSVLYLNLKFNLLSINLIACLQRWLILENHLGFCVLNYNWTSDKTQIWHNKPITV